jgi:hypothetical protein
MTERESPSGWADRIARELEAADARAKAVAGDLATEQLNWRRNPHEWSVGQCLDHLRATNDVYCDAMDRALTGQPARPVADITPGWFARWFIRNYIEPSPASKRGKAPRKAVPALTVDAAVLERFLESNRMARDFVRRAARYDVNRIRFVNPFVPLIRFTIGSGLQILSQHERRHLLQAERIRAALEGATRA